MWLGGLRASLNLAVRRRLHVNISNNNTRNNNLLAGGQGSKVLIVSD